MKIFSIIFSILNVGNGLIVQHTLKPKNPIRKIQDRIGKKFQKKVITDRTTNYLYDMAIRDERYSRVVNSISELGYFDKKILPENIDIQSLPMRTIVWLIRDLVLCKLTYVLNDENFNWITKGQIDSDEYSYDLIESLRSMKVSMQNKYLSSTAENIQNFTTYPKIVKQIIEYSSDQHRIEKYLPKNVIFFPEGTNNNMISAYFPDTNVITFAFRGTDLEESFFQDIIEDTVIALSGESIRSKRMIDTCTYIVEKFANKDTKIQTTGHSMGANVALDVALALNCTSIGINFGTGSRLPKQYRSLKDNIRNFLVHIHNPKDILSNNILQDTISYRIFNKLLRRGGKQNRYEIPTILTDIDNVRRLQLLEGGWSRYHSLLNILYEFEEALADKIYEIK